jgi:hypothetical protein
MSASLSWKPVPNLEKQRLLPDALMHVLRKSTTFSERADGFYSSENVPYLRGLQDAGVDGASELIKLIEKYETVELEEVY